ncbi:MAG: 3-phosphoglycerate dehydrogenase [Ruminococcaceae bacterium]|nr:3-phosphoglycerate dehydrogenase [Oscillospiraceae bacterium]
MSNILTLNKISKIGLSKFTSEYKISDNIENPDAIILRSFNMHEYEMPESLLAIGRAGAGVNNIPVEKCAKEGIVVFNTPGANANAVKELVLAGLFLASRDIVGGIKWAETLDSDQIAKDVEKGKGAFVGPEIMGKKLGVVGLGAIGILVANAAVHLGMEVIGYDPYISVDAAWTISKSIKRATDLKEIYESCDYITLHLPYNKDTAAMINTQTIAQMKDGVRILNFSRGELVDSDAMKTAIDDDKVAKYVCDFPSNSLNTYKNVVSIPHLGASTPEAEDNCAVMAVKQIMDFLENGNIVNSVNFPKVSMPRTTDTRITVIHENIPNMLSQISNQVAKDGINIEGMINGSKNDIAYTVLDVEGNVDEDVIADIENIEGVVRVRKIV